MNMYHHHRSSHLLQILCALAACAGRAHGGDQLLKTQLGADATLSIRLGPDQLLRDSLPKLYHFDWLVDGDETRPEYHWMTRPTEQRFDEEKRTLFVKHQWGHYVISFNEAGGQLRIEIRLKNATDKKIASMVIWLTDGFEFPQTPKGYAWSKGWAVMTKKDTPAVVLADYGRNAVAACLLSPRAGDSLGWGVGKKLTLQMADLEPGDERAVRISLRFGPGSDVDRDPHEMVQDIYEAFAAKHPMLRADWPDRRPIAALHPSSAHLGSGTAGKTTNPRGWIFGGGKVDVTTEEGKIHFTQAAMKFAAGSVEICQDMNAQGMICWSVEGQEWPHAISYIGSPDKTADAAPEMDAIADQWFKVFSDAGLRTGVCIRPQKLVLNPGYDPNGPPNERPFKYRQDMLWTEDRAIDIQGIIDLLDKKLSYANERWGCTLFYIDSNVASEYAKDPKTGEWKNVRWEISPYEVFAELAKRHPDCLLIPEHETLLYWTCSAPLSETSLQVVRLWPEAFSVNLMQHFKHDDLTHIQRCEELVRRGDILLFPGWYNARANKVIKGIYEHNFHPKWHTPRSIDSKERQQ